MVEQMQHTELQNSDDLLVERTLHGEAPAFGQLVDRHAQALFRIAFAIVGERMQAEDVVQETFLGAYRGMHRFGRRSAVKTWLVGILVKQARLALRKRKKMAALDEQLAGRTTKSDERMDIQQAISLLSEEHREVVVLREFEQLSYEQIATALQVPRGTVESRLYRARLEMRKNLSGYGKGEP